MPIQSSKLLPLLTAPAERIPPALLHADDTGAHVYAGDCATADDDEAGDAVARGYAGAGAAEAWPWNAWTEWV
jgi:hypothetical protein